MQNVRDVAIDEGGLNRLWVEPFLFSNSTLPKLRADFLPPVLRDLAIELNAANQTPIEMGIMLILSTLAACVQRRFEISPKRQTFYKETLSLWTLTILQPGGRKSAIEGAVKQPLVDWQKKMIKQTLPLIEERETENRVLQRRIDLLEKKSEKISDENDRRICVQEILKLKKLKKPELRSPELFTTNITPEQAENFLQANNERLAVLSSEGGIFEVISGLYNNGHSNPDVFLKGFSGDSIRVHRASRTVMVDRPAVSFGLTVQHDILKRIPNRFRGNGCLARFLYCLPDDNIGQRDVTQEGLLSDNTLLRYASLIDSLADLGLEDKTDRVFLGNQAYKHWQIFRQDIESKQGDGRQYESIQDWTAKVPGAALRIAALCHIAECGKDAITQEISGDSMALVLDFVEGLIPHTMAAFGVMEAEPVISDAIFAFRWICDHIESLDNGDLFFSQNALHDSSRFGQGKLDRVSKALQILADRNIVVGPSKVQTAGRPRIVWFVNPLALV
jgi:putative DNA primase/helicase